MKVKSILPSIVAAIGMSFGAAQVMADSTYPNKPIEIVVPYTAGSNMDRYPRAAAPALSEILGVPVVIQNVPGATGWNKVFRAKPDGYTLGSGEPVSQLLLELVQDLPYEAIGDTGFTWLGRFSTGNQIVGLSARSKFKSLDDMKNTADKVRCGTFGGLSVGALHCALLAKELNFDVAFVNLSGPPEAALATVRGDVDITSIGTVLWLDHITKGNIVPLVVWSDERDERAPDVPSLLDINMPGLAEATSFRAMFAPPGIPDEIKNKIYDAFIKAMSNDDYVKFLDNGKMDRNHNFSNEFPSELDVVNSLLIENKDVLESLY